MRKLVLCFVLGSVLFLNGCGTIFYPERRNNSTHIDPTVAVLDGIGLLFFLLPGVIAYAVDFTTGCIYLSGQGKHHNLTEVIHLDNSKDFNSQIDRILYSRYGDMSVNAMPVYGVIGVENWTNYQSLKYISQS